MKQTLSLIKAMRFPLIVLVVIIHSLGWFTLSGEGAGWQSYTLFSEMMSHNLGAIAVPLFFFFSGFLFFLNLENMTLCWSWIKNKWKKRINSLVIPYIVWNLLFVLAIVLKTSLFSHFGIGANDEIAEIQKGPTYWLLNPINYPLWYLRDLILMVAIAPVFYYLFKYTGIYGLMTILLIYLSPLRLDGFPLVATAYFGAGAYIGMKKIDFVQVFKPFRWPAAIASVILLAICTWFNNTESHYWYLRLFCPLGAISMINLFDLLTKSERLNERLCAMSSTVFFIYAAHQIYILGGTKGVLRRIFGEGLSGAWISYILTPIIVILICLLLYKAFKLFAPKTLAFLCGGRI